MGDSRRMMSRHSDEKIPAASSFTDDDFFEAETETNFDEDDEDDFFSDDSSWCSEFSTESELEYNAKAESCFIYTVVVIGFGLIGLIIYGHVLLQIIKPPKCVYDPRFKAEFSSEVQEWIEKQLLMNETVYNSANSEKATLKHLTNSDITFCLSMAQTFFVNAHYEYDKNDPEQITLKEQHAEIFGTNETDPSNKHLDVSGQVCQITFTPETDEDGSLIQRFGQNTTEIEMSCANSVETQQTLESLSSYPPF